MIKTTGEIINIHYDYLSNERKRQAFLKQEWVSLDEINAELDRRLKFLDEFKDDKNISIIIRELKSLKEFFPSKDKASALSDCSIKNSQHSCCLELKKRKVRP